MDSQPSTSSGAMDQRRKDALKGYREVTSIPFILLVLLIIWGNRKCEVMKQAVRV